MGLEQVNVAIVGTGFIADTRARCYAGVSGYRPRLVAAVSRTPERLDAYARRHGIADTYLELEPVLERSDVDVVDLCVPNHLHAPMAIAAAKAGKHVIVSKPLTACLADIPRQEMLREAETNATAMVEAARASRVMLMYA